MNRSVSLKWLSVRLSEASRGSIPAMVAILLFSLVPWIYPQVPLLTIERNNPSPVEYTAKDEIQTFDVANPKIAKATKDSTNGRILQVRGLKELGTTDIVLHLVNGKVEELKVEVVEKSTENEIVNELVYWRDRLAVLAPQLTVRGYPDKAPDRIELTGEYFEGEQEKHVQTMITACTNKKIEINNLARKRAVEVEMPKNIFVDVWLYLVTEREMKQFGFDYSDMVWKADGGVAGNITRSWGSAGSNAMKSVEMPGKISGGITVTVNHLSLLSNSKQLDHQLITVIEGQKAKKQFGGTVFLTNITQDTNTRTPVDFGTILNIVPTVMKQNPQFCQLDIEVESSSIGEQIQAGGEFNLIKDKTSQQVILEFGEPFLMANTFKNAKSKAVTGVVGLEKIPLLGELFKNRDFQEGKQEALLVVRVQKGEHIQQAPKLPQEARDLLEGKKIDTRDLLEGKTINP